MNLLKKFLNLVTVNCQTHENSKTDFGDQEDNALLLDRYASDLGGGTYVTDAVVWEDRDNLHCESVNFSWN